METLALIGLTALTGFYFKEKNPRTKENIRNVSQNDETGMPEIEKPSSSNMYESDMVASANKEVLERSLANYADSENPSKTGILPPLYNSYTVVGSDYNFGKDSSNKALTDIKNINTLVDVTAKEKPALVDRPMFNPLQNFIGTELPVNNFTDINIGNEITNTDISLLTGQPINREHANMVPFFGSNIKQGQENFTNESLLDKYTGSTSTFIHKNEQKQRFENYQQDLYGTPSLTENIQIDRYIPSTQRQGEKPFYPEKISALKAFSLDNPVTDASITEKNIDQLRAANNPQISYEARKNAGLLGSLLTVKPNVNKNRVDTYYEHGPDRLFTSVGQITATKNRENYVSNFQPTSRQDQNIEQYGPLLSQNLSTTQRIQTSANVDNSDKLTNALHKESTRQSLDADYSRNINNKNAATTIDNYNVNSYNPYTQERETTNDQHIVNANRSKDGQIIGIQDDVKNTIKQTTLLQDRSGNINTNYNKGKNSANDIGITNIDFKSTNKESYVDNEYKGHLSKNDGMGYTVAKYNAKPTNSEINVNKDYVGNAIKENKNSKVYSTFANPIKVRNAVHSKNYVGMAGPSMQSNENRTKYNNAEITNKKEKLLKNSRPNGRKSSLGTTSSGADKVGKLKLTQNMLLKENKNNREKTISNTASTIPSKVFIGEQRVAHNRYGSVENDRLIGNIVKKVQLKENPFYNLK